MAFYSQYYIRALHLTSKFVSVMDHINFYYLRFAISLIAHFEAVPTLIEF
jgi:hypothetical protein